MKKNPEKITSRQEIEEKIKKHSIYKENVRNLEWKNKSINFLEFKDCIGEMSKCQEKIIKDKGNSNIWYRLGELYYRLGYYGLGEKYVKKARKMSDEDMAAFTETEELMLEKIEWKKRLEYNSDINKVSYQ